MSDEQKPVEIHRRDRRAVAGNPWWSGSTGTPVTRRVGERSRGDGFSRSRQPGRPGVAAAARRCEIRAHPDHSAHLFAAAGARVATRRRGARILRVVLVVPARAAARRDHRPRARAAGDDQLPQRRGAGSSAPLGDRTANAAGRGWQRRAVAVPQDGVRRARHRHRHHPEHHRPANGFATDRDSLCGHGCCRRATSRPFTTSTARCALSRWCSGGFRTPSSRSSAAALRRRRCGTERPRSASAA